MKLLVVGEFVDQVNQGLGLGSALACFNISPERRHFDFSQMSSDN